MPKILIRYRWRYYDPLREKHFNTRHWATAEDFLPAHPDATPIAGTRQLLEVSDDPLIGTSMAKFNTGTPEG